MRDDHSRHTDTAVNSLKDQNNEVQDEFVMTEVSRQSMVKSSDIILR